MTLDAVQLFVGGSVHLCDAQGSRAAAVAFAGGRVLAVGTEREVTAAAGAGAEVVDLGGRALVPGFIDAHQHPSISALYGGTLRLTRPRIQTIADIQSALRESSKLLAPERWLVASQLDELQIRERRVPTREELDDAVPDRPLMIMHYSCHRVVANSRALELAGITRHTADPSGGSIERGKDGQATGLLLERAIGKVETLARASLLASDAEGFLERLAAHHEELLSLGVTGLVDAAVPRDVATLYREALRRGLLRVPTVMMCVATHGYLDAPWDGHRHEPDECVSLPEALAMVTRAAARAAGLSDVGSLEVGQRANAVLLSGPLETEADLEAAHVRATWLDGERVYGEA